MTLVPTGDLIAAAVARRGAVAALNVITLEHAEAIVAAAEAAGAAVILQISENAVRYHGGQVRPIAAAAAALGQAAGVPVALHLDHVTDPDLAAEAPTAGFSSLMFDAGALPYADNVAQTAAAVHIAHDAGLWIEAELGYVGGKPDAPQSAHAAGVRTDPDEAVEFVADTGVDALAVAVGSSHAMTTRTAALDTALIARLRDRLDVPLVLHGSSGVPDEELRAAVKAGIAKVNVGTALNMAMTAAVRASLDADAELVDVRTYLRPAREAMTRTVRQILALLP
ncbi:MAG TPA: class II fructose-bisphosphate aldolase [Jatrophihabitans sp.]|jgi:fructose-bisphosphate aldolase class II